MQGSKEDTDIKNKLADISEETQWRGKIGLGD